MPQPEITRISASKFAVGVALLVITGLIVPMRELRGQTITPKVVEVTSQQSVSGEELETFVIELDPSVSCDERKRRGNYAEDDFHHRSRYITAANSHLTRKVRRTIVLYKNDGGYVATEEMIRRMRQNKDRPAGVDDALEFGYEFPSRQLRNPIVFLDPDSFYLTDKGDLGDRPAATMLCGGIGWGGPDRPTWRTLSLGATVRDSAVDLWPWDSSFRFAAVRKEDYLDKEPIKTPLK